MPCKRYVSRLLEANCYLLQDQSLTLIIDPCVSYQTIRKDLKNNIDAILITHGHFDHFLELNSYLENTDAKIYLHKNAIEKLESSVKNCSRMCGYNYSIDCNHNERFIPLTNNKLVIKNTSIYYIETFGHTNCCVTYMINDMMFTGDFLFKRSVGRTDLFSGNSAELNQSLKKIKQYAIKDYVIYPGHDDSTTLFEEMDRNPYLKTI